MKRIDEPRLWLQNDLITRHYQAVGAAAEFEAAEAA